LSSLPAGLWCPSYALLYFTSWRLTYGVENSPCDLLDSIQ
jgi:hypothetical protein